MKEKKEKDSFSELSLLSKDELRNVQGGVESNLCAAYTARQLEYYEEENGCLDGDVYSAAYTMYYNDCVETYGWP